MNLFGMIDSSGGAMQAERMRAEVVAANMANAESTRTASGAPYRRQHVVFAAGAGDGSFAGQVANQFARAAAGGEFSSGSGLTNSSSIALPGSFPGFGAAAPGVRVAAVVQDTAPPLKRYDPGHPDADGEGFVSYPDINPLTEMVDLMGATRAYGLNGSAVQAEKSMITAALEIAK